MTTVTRWDPRGHLAQLQREMDRMFEGHPYIGIRTTPWLPPTDIEQTEDAVIYTLDLPGLKTEDITIQVQDGALTVSGSREHDVEEKHEGYYTRERTSGQFARTYTLPKDTGQGDITAAFDDGVLTITVPRKEEVKPRTIEIGTEG